MTGDSRKKFDIYFRTLISGTDQAHPKPKSFKLAKVIVKAVGQSLGVQWIINLCDIILSQSNLFPERATVFDYFFKKVGGMWADWEDLIERGSNIPAKAKVSNLHVLQGKGRPLHLIR